VPTGESPQLTPLPLQLRHPLCQIRPYEPADWPAITEDEARAAWVMQSQAVMVAADAAESHGANAASASIPCRRQGGWAKA